MGISGNIPHTHKLEIMKRSSTMMTTQTVASSASKKSRSRAKTSLKPSSRGQQKSLLPSPAASVPRWGFPNRLAIKHKYTDIISYNSSAGALASYLYSCNGMFDPNRTGTGNQPMYFDELAALYDHYTVVKSYARFTFTTQTTNNNNAQIALTVDDDTTPPASIVVACMQGTATTATWQTGQTQPLVLTKSWNSGAFGPNVLDNDQLQGTGSSDPSEQSYYTLSMAGIGGNTTNFFVTAEIWYYAIWDELKTNSGS